VSTPFAALILAAGKGTRMKSDRPKVLHEVCGVSMIRHAIDCALAAGAERVVPVIGHGAEQVRAVAEAAPGTVTCVVQEQQLGTGHAVRVCEAELGGYPHPVLILNGDVPLITPDLLTDVLAHHRKSGGGITVVTVQLDDPTGYGRMVRGKGGDLERVVEQKDASPEERAVREVNTGIYVADPQVLFPLLARVSDNNAQGEYYLTDIVGLSLADGRVVHVYRATDPDLVLGVNSRRDLAQVSAVLRRRIHNRLMDEGVTLLDPSRTDIDAGVRIGPDTVIHPGVTLQGATVIGVNCEILPGTRIVDATLGDGITVKDNCLIDGATLAGHNTVGPMAHLRPGTALAQGAKIGNFVEIKKADIGVGSKVNHLSYVGDATVGKGVNIGAGTITCNYDGVNKFQTVIGDHVFVGSDTQLVAPVTVGEGATIGAGTTVTRDVPADALAVSRTEQKNVAGWAKRRRQPQSKKEP